MNKTLNFRFLIGLLVIVAVAAGAIYLLHRRQADKQAQAYLHQADEAQKKGDLPRTVNFLSRYLTLEQSDSNVRARMGFAMARLAKRPDEKLQAFFVFEQVLRDDPKRDDVRLRNTRLAMDPALSLYDEALGHLKILSDAKPDDAELLDLTGQCLVAKGEYAAANEMFAKAIERKPDSILTYARCAGILRLKLKDTEGAEDKANNLIEDLVKKNEQTAHAHLIAAIYWKEYGTEAKSDALMAKALELGKHDGEVLLKAAEFALNRAERLRRSFKADESKTEIESARQLLQLGIEKNPVPEVDTTAAEDEQDRVALKRAIVAELYRNRVALEVRTDQLAEAEKQARQGVELLPDQVELVLSLADVQIRQDKFAEAADNLKKLQDNGYPQAVLDYHRARIHTRKNEWLAASHVLERIIPDLVVVPVFSRQANFLLGECYDRLGEVDLRYEAFKNARPSDIFDPLWVPASVAFAASQAEMGRTKEAIETYRSVARFAPGAVLPLVRLLVIDVLRQPAEKRDWKEVDELMKLAPESLDATLLRADILAARDLLADAKKTIDAVKEKYADQVELSIAYALLAFAQKDSTGAEKLLKDAETKFGDRVEIRLARARMLPAPATPESTKRLAELASGNDKFSVEDRRRLLVGISEWARSVGAIDLAAQLWESLALTTPDNLGVHHKRFDRAMQTDDEPAMLKVLDNIRRIDGQGGSSTRMARSLYLIWKARKGDKSGLAEAEKHLVELEEKRGRWARVPLALAVVYELKGDISAAIPKYQAAVNLGEKDPEVISRLIQLYYARQQFTEAEVLLRNVSEAVTKNETIQLIASEVSLQSNNYVKALEMAEKAVTLDTKDYQKQLWLGRVRWMCGEKEKAEEPLRKAVQLAGDKPETWIALIQYLANSDRKADAEKLFDEAKQRVKKEDVALLLAQGYEILDRMKEAQEWYDKALAERPKHVGVLRSTANYRLRQVRTKDDLEQIADLLERILQLTSKTPEDANFARNMLATVLAMNPDYQKSRRALEILGLLNEDLSNPNSASTVDEMRAQAVVLSLQRGRKPRERAIQLLSKIDTHRPLPPDNRFLLSQLLFLVGERQQARGQLVKLVNTNATNPLFLSTYIRFLIFEGDAGDLVEAQKRLAELERLQPNGMATAELRARLLVANKKNKEAVDGLLAYVKTRKDMALSAARLLEDLKEFATAETLYRQVIDDSKKPIARLILAEFYARQNRNADALHLLEMNTSEYPAATLAMAALSFLYTVDQPRQDDIRRVRALLQKNAPKGSDLAMEEAALSNLEGEYSKAIATYERIIARDPKNALAINNYAFLLAFHEKKIDAALDWIRKARAQTRPDPVLFDTEALILIQSGNPKAAVALLVDAVVDAPTASSYFHLAQAHLADGARLDAKAALAKSKKIGLRPSDLHPLEREAYQNLLRELSE
jgi:predicted Zn-dependent protease